MSAPDRALHQSRKFFLRQSGRPHMWGCWGVGRSKERDGATVTETGSGKPALRQALQARGPDLDLIRELPSGPAACEPHQRPHTCQHPTARCTNPEDSSCAKAGVHTCRKVFPTSVTAPMFVALEVRKYATAWTGSPALFPMFCPDLADCCVLNS